ncbi:MAG: hypothetical protein HY321_04115 [Armatimonadetes bacterium]|nr:hypothetical protein [Armatimonadota bacterium]
MVEPIIRASLLKKLMVPGTLLLFSPGAPSAGAATYYASPAGGGDGLRADSPFRIADFWGVAKPGDTLLLLDGTYRGRDAMINPPNNLNGEPGNPITVKALHDGQVEIDGEGANTPVALTRNNHFVLEGFNAHGSMQSVVILWYSSHNIIRRVCGWDAFDGNVNIFGARHGEHNLFEDCAGWGIARKVFSNSQQGNHTTFRRCWGRWEGSHCTGPKLVFALSYNSYHALAENCIGTWNAIGMRESYDLQDASGKPLTGRSAAHYDHYEVRMPSGIFSHDAPDGDNSRVANARLFGCIAYLRKGERFHSSYKWWIGPYNLSLPGIALTDCLSIIEPGGWDTIRNTQLGDPREPGLNTAENLTLIGGKDVQIHPEWKTRGILVSRDGSELTANGKHILDPSLNGSKGGATIMKRYVDGKLTDEDLWPWPMNQRIIDAMRRSGREPVDVTKTVFEFCGGTPPPIGLAADGDGGHVPGK